MALLSQNPKERAYMLLGLRIAGDFGASIAVPVVVFVLIGQWADERYASSPRYTILAFVLAALLSGKMIYSKAKSYAKEYSFLEKNDTKKEELPK